MLKAMGLVTTKITLNNPRYPDQQPIEVEALADTGSVHMCIPQHIAIQLGLEQHDQKDLVVSPKDRRIDVNPENPNIARSIVK